MNSELILYYLNLLIIQYNDKPKAQAHLTALIDLLMIYDLIQDVKNGYNIDDAIGVQQDILGKYIGTDRTVTGIAFDRVYFGFIDYFDTPPVAGISGYMLYNDIVPDVQYRSYIEETQSLFELNDEEFRTIQKLKIIQNNSNHSIESIDDLITELFEGRVIFNDRFDMTISYIFSESDERLVAIAQSEGLIPKPMAVSLSISYTPDVENIFTYGFYGGSPPSFAVGYKLYGIPLTGGWAQYG